MLITRECDYAVRVLRAMAEEKRVSVNEICEKELITAPFAYKILKKLQKSGMVRGYRGVHGGYSLNCDLDQITLYDVYTTIDPGMLSLTAWNLAMTVPGTAQTDRTVLFTVNSRKFRKNCAGC